VCLSVVTAHMVWSLVWYGTIVDRVRLLSN